MNQTMNIEERMAAMQRQREVNRERNHFAKDVHTGEGDTGWFAVVETDKGHIVWIHGADVMRAAAEIAKGIQHANL